MALQTEIWEREIKEKLLPENHFISHAISDDAHVFNGKVHLPQAGDLPNVVKNRTVIPAAIAGRTDRDFEYPLAEFSTDPTVVRRLEEQENSYDKRLSVVKGHVNQLNLQMVNDIAFGWAPTDSQYIVRTTGDAVAANTAGATGNRKMMTIPDILKAKRFMDDMDVPMGFRNILFTAHHYNDLLEQNWQFLLAQDKVGKARIENGQNLTALFGFRIFTRGKKNVLRYTGGGAPKAVTTAGSATDNAATLIWGDDFVRRAKGSVEVFHEEGKAAYYGDLFSAVGRAGGKQAFDDGTGVVAIVEDAA